MSDCFVLYLLLICMKKEKTGAGKFTNNNSPYETFSFLHGEDVLEKLGCRPVAATDIMLKPAIFKK